MGWSVEEALTKQLRKFDEKSYITYNGKTLTTILWAERMGIKYKTLFKRLSDGWDIEKALTTPTRRIYLVEEVLLI